MEHENRILDEPCANLRRVAPRFPLESAGALVRRYRAWTPWAVDEATVDIAWGLQDDLGLGYWGAPMLAAARRQGCRFLLTEDLPQGQTIDGIRVVNPFLAGPDLIDAAP